MRKKREKALNKKIGVIALQRAISELDEMIKIHDPSYSSSSHVRMYRARGSNGNKNCNISTLDTANEMGMLKFNETFGEIEPLVDLKFRLKSLIDDFNYSNGVRDNMNIIAKNKQLIAHLESIVDDIGESKFDSVNEQYSVGLSQSDMVNIKSKIIKLKREVKKLTDDCAKINAGGLIVLGDSHEKLIKLDLI